MYEIASCLNKEFFLQAALKKALEKTVQLLELETGWIWLMQGDKSVYLASSYNLPPALRDHPERLSGRCFCIDKYLSDGMNSPRNISEVVCSRLHSIKSGTNELKFHASIPITIGEHKAGIINLLSKESQQLNSKQLCILNTISELIAMAIQRTQGQNLPASSSEGNIQEALNRVVKPKLQSIIHSLQESKKRVANGDVSSILTNLEESSQQADFLLDLLSHIEEETDSPLVKHSASNEFHYPATPLTERELELLPLIQKGYTNKQIADVLFISERTVKFHITSILSKLPARTRTEAVNIALRRGLVSL